MEITEPERFCLEFGGQGWRGDHAHSKDGGLEKLESGNKTSYVICTGAAQKENTFSRASPVTLGPAKCGALCD